MPLDAKGKVSVAAIAFDAPIFLLSLLMTAKFKTRFHNLTFPALMIYGALRITGSTLVVYGELHPHNSTTALIFAGNAIISTAVAPILIVNSGMIVAIAQHSSVANHATIKLDAVLIKIFTVLGLTNSIGGGILGLQHPHTMRIVGGNIKNAGAIFYLVALVRVCLQYLHLYVHSPKLTPRRRKFLFIVAASVPFLIARTVYTNIVGFVAVTDHIAPQKGDYRFYLVLVFVLEYIMVIIYYTAVFLTRIEFDAFELGENGPGHLRNDSDELDKKSQTSSAPATVDDRPPTIEPIAARSNHSTGWFSNLNGYPFINSSRPELDQKMPRGVQSMDSTNDTMIEPSSPPPHTIYTGIAS